MIRIQLDDALFSAWVFTFMSVELPLIKLRTYSQNVLRFRIILLGKYRVCRIVFEFFKVHERSKSLNVAMFLSDISSETGGLNQTVFAAF